MISEEKKKKKNIYIYIHMLHKKTVLVKKESFLCKKAAFLQVTWF